LDGALFWFCFSGSGSRSSGAAIDAEHFNDLRAWISPHNSDFENATRFDSINPELRQHVSGEGALWLNRLTGRRIQTSS